MFPVQLLKIRFLQIFRALVRIPLHALLILSALVVIIKLLYQFSSHLSYSIYTVLAIWGVALLIQYHRNDKRFVFKILDKAAWQIFLEYFIFSSFFTFGCLLTSHWYIYVMGVIGLFFISRLQFLSHYKTPLKNLSKLIPAFNFEIISGLRRSYFILWPLYVAAFVFCWVRILPLFIIWFINIQFAGYFSENESLQMVTANGEKRWSFILKKIFRNLLFITIIFSPIVAIQCYLFPEIKYMAIAFMIVQYLLLIFSIVYKYALYEPAAPSTNNSIMLAVVSMLAILPYSLPLLLILDTWFIIKANKNLKTYLL